MSRLTSAGAAALLASLLLAGTNGGRLGAPSHPDLTGVWTDYIDPQQPAAAGGQAAAALDLPLTPTHGRRSSHIESSSWQPAIFPVPIACGHAKPALRRCDVPDGSDSSARADHDHSELHNDVRRLYLGSRTVPEADRLPGRKGYSAARWDGDALVVETTNLVEQVDQRYPHSDRAQVVERYQLTRSLRGERVLVIDMTKTDPVFYTRPVTGQKKWVEVPTATCCRTTALRKDGEGAWMNSSSAPPRRSE